MASQAAAGIHVRGLCKRFITLDATITALDGVDLDVLPGTVTGLCGPSGSGKSTLLHLIGGLDTPDEGTVTVGGHAVDSLRGNALAAYRRTVGFVFQSFHLIPTLTVLDNVLAPVIPTGRVREHRLDALQLLDSIGLSGRENSLATRLSGGQQQRVALARAVIGNPQVILADEPTGNLDSSTGMQIIDLLLALRAERGVTLLIATHDPDLANRCDTIVTLRDGRLAEPMVRE